MTTTITGLRAERAVPAKSGRSFDFAGFRVRLEAGHGDDRVPVIVDYLVECINTRPWPVEGVEWCVTHQGVVDEASDRSGPDGAYCDRHYADDTACDIRPLFHGWGS